MREKFIVIDKIPAFSRLLGLLCPITEHLRKLATKFVVTSSTEINFPVLMNIWPEDGLLISDKHPLFLFMSVVFFGGCSSWLVAVNLGTLHYETSFDYYSLLSDPNASKLVEKYYNFYKKDINRKLKLRNWMRYSNGRLTYPYLQYPWLPNGVST